MGPCRAISSSTIDPPRTGRGGHERPPSCGLRTPVGFAQHPDEHRSQYPILLAVDQELGEGAALRVPQKSPIRSARSKSGSMRTVEEFSAGSGTERVQALPPLLLKLIRTHVNRRLRRRRAARDRRRDACWRRHPLVREPSLMRAPKRSQRGPKGLAEETRDISIVGVAAVLPRVLAVRLGVHHPE